MEEPVLEEIQPWEAAVDELRLHMEDLQKKVEEDHKLVHEQLQNQAVQAQVYKDEVMQNLLSIKEMIGGANSCVGQEVGGTPQTPGFAQSVAGGGKIVDTNAASTSKRPLFDPRNIQCPILTPTQEVADLPPNVFTPKHVSTPPPEWNTLFTLTHQQFHHHSHQFLQLKDHPHFPCLTKTICPTFQITALIT